MIPLNASSRFQSFDLLATLVAVLDPSATVLFSNSALEDVLGTSRKTIDGSYFPEVFTEPSQLQSALEGLRENEFSTLRYDAWLKRPGQDSMPVHVIVNRTESADAVIVEMVPLEQQTRQDREERLAEQAQTNKELIRNLAHEIKNPLGGIRGCSAVARNGDGLP